MSNLASLFRTKLLPHIVSGFGDMKVWLFKNYGTDPGKMLIHTGVAGWILSSAAQIIAIMTNDKVSKEQKMFMIPQEFADATVNIISFIAITQSVKYLSSKLVSCGKLLPKKVFDFLKNEGYGKAIGKFSFDIGKHVKMPKDIKADYNAFKDGIDVIGTIAGSVVSCNIVTPILRNKYASYRQKENIAKLNKQNPNPNDNIRRTSLQTFMSNGSLKV